MKVYVKGEKPVTLKNNDFKAQGGEGMIYCRGERAYKIYTDKKKIIPIEKIAELSNIQHENVLAPHAALFDYKTNKQIGFTMKFIRESEYLCKLFTNSFRVKKSISPEMICDIVENMRQTLLHIHKTNILVVDFNEMNFLTDKLFATVYFIDVDSYQTENYKATAIMDSIRDRLAPHGKFSEMSDWFSFAVVTFQLFMGCHPYKGRHQQYSLKEIASYKMMDDGISVFHPDVRLPAGSQDWSVIPKSLYEWYKKVFLHKERTIPPAPSGDQQINIVYPAILSHDARFDVIKVEDYDTTILDVRYVGGIRYVLTENGLWSGNSKIDVMRNDEALTEFCIFNRDVIVGEYYYKGKTFDLFSINNKKRITTVGCDDVIVNNNTFYTVLNGVLFEHSFVSMNKTVHQAKPICDIFEPSYQLFDGVIVQNILAKCWLAIPYRPGACSQLHVKELDNHRVIDAACKSGNGIHVCVIIAEKNGIYRRFVLCLNSDCRIYAVRFEEVEVEQINFIVLSNGLCVTTVGDHKLEAFYDNTTIKVFKNPPVHSSMRLYTNGSKVFFTKKNTIYQLSLGA